MRIQDITLTNFRLYRGVNKISFPQDAEGRNIYLISGENGFGKTTFLHSLLWCLYGRLMAEIDDTARKEISNCGGYGPFLISNLNNNAKQYVESIDADSHAMDTLRRRAGVIGFRAGMLCYLLENRKFTKTVAQFAEWVAEYVFRNQMELWGEQMEQELTGALDIFSGERGSASSLLALLPNEFTTGDLIKLRARQGQSVTPTSVNSLLCRWRKLGRIDKSPDGKWHRLQ